MIRLPVDCFGSLAHTVGKKMTLNSFKIKVLASWAFTSLSLSVHELSRTSATKLSFPVFLLQSRTPALVFECINNTDFKVTSISVFFVQQINEITVIYLFN